VEAVLRVDLERVRAARRREYARERLLDRLRHNLDRFLDLVELALVGEGIGAPALLDDVEGLEEHASVEFLRLTLRVRRLERGELGLERAAPDAEVVAPIREVVDRGDLLGD